MIVISGQFPINASKREEALNAFRHLQSETQKEKGCLNYNFSIDLEDANLVRVFEKWESEELLAHHAQTEHIKRFLVEAPQLLAGKAKVSMFKVSSETPLSL